MLNNRHILSNNALEKFCPMPVQRLKATALQTAQRQQHKAFLGQYTCNQRNGLWVDLGCAKFSSLLRACILWLSKLKLLYGGQRLRSLTYFISGCKSKHVF